MIVQVRGCSGAGKSYLVRQLLLDHGGERIEERQEPPFVRANGDRVDVHLWRCDDGLRVMGKYDLDSTSRGGGDFVSGSVGREIIRRYAPRFPHFVWESKFGSEEANADCLLEARGLGIVWAVLDTPLEECIRRIYARRVERNRNVGRPLNEQKITESYRYVHRDADRARGAGIRVVELDHRNAYEELLALLAEGGWVPNGSL
jgi:hypothetical protein